MTSMDRQYVWNVANLVRECLGLSTPLSIQKLTQAVETIGGECISVSDPSPEEDSNFDACIDTHVEGASQLRFRIRYAAWKPERRILFSIAHELGHFFLHLLKNDGTVEKKATLYRDFQGSTKEWQANEFAAALLMPEKEFIATFEEELEKSQLSGSNNINVGNIADHFGVSAPAAMVRGQILQLW